MMEIALLSDPDRHEWWQTAVVYQVYVRSFKDTTGNGVGDLQGIIDHMDYLSDTLGVDAIWITPFYPSPMADFGYDVSDYCDVHPLFGDLATFDRLVARAHDAGLKVLIDFVPNHSSDQHSWFIESRSSRANPRRDWYVWRDPKPDGSPPNNWLSVFGGSAWELDERTGQCYLHSFLKEQPDLNWQNPALKAAMLDNMRFWLDRGVDGFRLDAVLFMMKDPHERDNPLNRDGSLHMHKSLGAYESQVHVHDQGHADVHQVFRHMRALLNEYEPARMALAEMHVFDWERLASYYGEDLDGVNMPANFGLLKVPWTTSGVREAVDGLEAALPRGAWPNYVLGSHDDQRLATRLGEHGSRQAAVLLLTLRGSPTLYYGDELGMREADIPAHQQQDPWGMSEPGLSRDGCRTPMRWSPDATAGFTAAEDPWLPVGSDHATRNVESQLSDPESHLNLYRRLLSLRRNSAALRGGAYRPLDPVPPECFAFERVEGSERVLVAINYSTKPVSVDTAGITGRIAVSTERANEGIEITGALQLLPHEAVVVVEE
ncbi:MAG: alpha-amylase family glycosyl hydrolase [Gemmatimonadota bacterium]|nr:alpha-amylase family glycosyl hydrolase [Gemmatimonadota bacterium]